MSLISSCKKKNSGCTDGTALNYNGKATEDDGSCIYDPAKKYEGDYHVIATEIEQSFFDTLHKNYNVHVKYWWDGNCIIHNIRNMGGEISVETQNGNITIEEQTDFPENHFIISGNGTFNNDTIRLDYYIQGAGSFDPDTTGTAICVKY